MYRICLSAYVKQFNVYVFFLMMYLLWVVTNQWIFTEIGHGLVFFNVVYFVMAYCCQYIIDIFCIDSVRNLFVLLLNILKKIL